MIRNADFGSFVTAHFGTETFVTRYPQIMTFQEQTKPIYKSNSETNLIT